MQAKTKRHRRKTITAAEFDAKAERGEDITPYLDLTNAKVVLRPALKRRP